MTHCIWPEADISRAPSPGERPGGRRERRALLAPGRTSHSSLACSVQYSLHESIHRSSRSDHIRLCR